MANVGEMMNKRMIAIVVSALLLSGCAAGTFTTRASITLAQDKVILCNQFGVLPCIGTEMDQRDAWVIIEALKARAALEARAGAVAPAPKPARAAGSDA
jgi:PBP1b-binding outer membrane lipoprotein LpoB